MDRDKNTFVSHIITAFVSSLIVIFFLNNKYEGATAKQWYNEYDYTIYCLQEIRVMSSSGINNDDYDQKHSKLEQIYNLTYDCI